MSRFLLIALAGCSLSYEELDHIEEVCSKVDETRWATPMRGELTAHDACRQSSMNILDGQNPCTFGGLPGWCRVHENGGVSFHRGISPYWMDIEASEWERMSTAIGRVMKLA